MVSELKVEICYGLVDKQDLIALTVPEGTTVQQAIELSNIYERYPEITIEEGSVGIFSRKVAISQVLRDGDRVEIYRPLQVDPKEARRLKSLKQHRS